MSWDFLQKLIHGGYAGTVDPALVNTKSTATGQWTPAPVNPSLPGLSSPGAQSNPYLTMPLNQRGSATGNGGYGIPEPVAVNPNVNPPANPSPDDLSNSRYRWLQPDHNGSSPPPLDPDRMIRYPKAAPTNLHTPAVTAPLPPPRPNDQPQDNSGYEYYQYEDDNGHLVWGTRPKGYGGAMGGDAPYAAQGFQGAGTGMSLDQANAFQRQRPAGQPTGFVSPQANAVQGNGPLGNLFGNGAPQLDPSHYPPGTDLMKVQSGAQPQGNVVGYTPEGKPILGGDPQAGLPSWMKGSPVGNILQAAGAAGGGASAPSADQVSAAAGQAGSGGIDPSFLLKLFGLGGVGG